MFGNDPDRPDVRPPKGATCGTCALCDKSGDVFSQLDDEMFAQLSAQFGLCTDIVSSPLLVELGTGIADMPCGGDAWSRA